jgi:VanZ family protein
MNSSKQTNSRTLAVLLRLPAVLVALAIWVLSSQTTLPIPKGVLGRDKVQHLAAYLVLAGTIALWFPREHWAAHRLRTLAFVFCIALVYGGGDEIHQYFVPGRDCNIWDWLADALGAIIGCGLALPFMGWINRKYDHAPASPKGA